MFQIVHDQSRFAVVIEQRTDPAEKLGVHETARPFPMKIFVVFLVAGVELLHAIGQIANCPEVLHVNVRVRWRHLAVVVGVSSHYYRDYVVSEEERKKRRKEGIVLFNDALNTFYLRLYGVRHMVKDHSDSERGNPLPPHGLLFPISSKGSFICIIPQTG